MQNYLNQNLKYWNEPYNAENVESYIFRLKPVLLDKFIKKKKLKVLDYGCGVGAQILYLIKKHNFDGYGVDISKDAIKKCHKLMPNRKNKFKLISSECFENDRFFNTKFDLIIANQSLYYLNDQDLKIRLLSLKNHLSDNGHIFATMMSTKNSYYNLSKPENLKFKYWRKLIHKDLDYKKRHKKKVTQCYLNFVDSPKMLKKKFSMFKPLSIGQYDLCYNLNLPGHHFTFFGSV